MGGAVSLSENVQLVHSFTILNGHFWLDAAVLLRGSRPGWYFSTTPAEQHAPVKPPPAPGGGARVGLNSFFINRRDRILLINRILQIPLSGFNVVMLDHADDSIARPVVHEMLPINPDLGPAPSDPMLTGLESIHAIQELTRSLQEFARVREFCALG